MSVQQIRVPAGFLFGLLFLFYSRPFPHTLEAGLLVALLGLGLRIWAAGHLEKWQKLAVRGPYRFTRNPLYLGSFLMGLGFTLASSRVVLFVLFLLIFSLLYVPVMKREENELSELYGEDYRRYRQRVSLFFPGKPLSLSESQGGVPFQWNQVWNNREYNALLGFLGFSLFLYLRLKWSI